MVWTPVNTRAPSHTDISAATGQPWRQWAAILDAWDGDRTRVRPIISYLMYEYDLSRFWAQVIATYYLMERVREPSL